MQQIKKIEPWMFRTSGEWFTLFVTLIFVTLLAYLLYEFSITVFVAFLVVAIAYIYLKQGKLIGNSLKVQKDQFPSLHNVFVNYCKQLELTNVSLYITQDPYPNAYAFGFTKGNIVLSSAIAENFTLDELKFVIAHELGHVKAKHHIINTFIGSFGTGNPFSGFIFNFWGRKAEYTADNCALAVTKDLDAGIEVILKINVGLKIAEEINLEGYRKQLIEAQGTLSTLGEMLATHPLGTNRLANLVRFKREYFK